MKLMIPLVDGANLTFEGTYDELVQVAEDFVKKHAATIAVSGTASAAQQGTQPRVNAAEGARGSFG